MLYKSPVFQLFILLSFFTISSYAQWDDFDKLTKRPLLKKPFTVSEVFSVNDTEPIPTLLKSIQLIANSNGTLSAPRFIYKGDISGYESKIKDPGWFTDMIADSSLSSVSPDDNGQFYVSQAAEQSVYGMLKYMNNVLHPEIELRFGSNDAGLAIDPWSGSYYKIFRVPFTAWDLNGTPNNPDDDEQLLIYAVSGSAGDTTGNWGIRDGYPSSWTFNPAQESDWIYIVKFATGKSYADLEDCWEYQNVNNTSAPGVATLYGGFFIRRITINSLDSNPLTTIDTLNGLPRPAPGTVIRWNFEIGVRINASPLFTVVGEELIYTAYPKGFPEPQCQLVSGPPGMYMDENNTIHWTPTVNDTGITEYTISATNYRGTVESTNQIYVDPVPVSYKNHENKLKGSVFNNGLIGGYTPGANSSDSIGDGISYNGINGLYAGGIFMALSNDEMAGRTYMQKQRYNDFLPLTAVLPIDSPIPDFDQAYYTQYNDRRYERETGKLGITITQNSYSSSQIPTNGFIIIDYTVHNDNNHPLDSLYFAMYADFDIIDFSKNLSGYDPARKLAYEYMPDGADSAYYYGIMLLKGEVSGFTSKLQNIQTNNAYDSLSVIRTPGEVVGDNALLLAGGPYSVEANESFRVVYAVVAGADLNELLNNADYARQVNLDYEAGLVTFQVDMNIQQEIGAFQPDSGDMVILRGSFNDWEQGNKYRLDNPDGSSIYKLPVMINKPAGEEIEYKFLIVSADSVVKKWENPLSGRPPTYNRVLNLSGEVQTLPVVLFDDATLRTADSLALVEIYNSMNGENWANKDNWLSDQPIDNWYGVTVAEDRVTTLNLENNDLSGTLSPAIGNLTGLQILFLNNNSITGGIPPQLYNLINLSELYLNSNSFNGELSEDIGKLENLRVLALWQNYFSGPLPTALGNLSNLEILDLPGNSFSGEWPLQVLNLKKLTFLSLANNNFSGSIPNEIGNLTQLTELILNGNAFSGSVPGEINNLEKLTKLEIHENQLEVMPALTGLTNLKNLLMQSNQFTFEDIEPNLDIPADTIIYAPQDSVGIPIDTLADEKSDYMLCIEIGGENNLYQWYKNNEAIAGATSGIYTLTNIQQSDRGVYTCRITNSLATDLTLYSRPVTLDIKSIPIIGSEGDLNDVRATYCRLSAHILPYDNDVNVKFLYGKSSVSENEVPYEHNPVSGTNGVDVAVELTGLQPGTEYRWQVVISSDGKTDNSIEHTFTTLSRLASVNVNETVTFPGHSSPSDYAASDYRLIGLPGNGKDIVLSDIMPGEFKSDWTAYWDNGAQNDYLVEFNNSDIFKLIQGRAFWVISKNAVSVNLNIPQADFDAKDAAAITLHNGWNIITNPLDVTVSLEDIKAESGISGNSEALWMFNGNWDQRDRMEPKKGYYFFNSENISQLKVPLKPLSSMKKRSIEKDTTFVTIGLEVNNTDTDKIFFAINDNIKNFYIHKPRTISGMNGIYYLKPDWDENYPAFLTDVRKSGEQIYDIPFYVGLESSGKAALQITGIDNISDNSEIYLVDLETATYQDLRENDNYIFSAFRKTRSFKLFIGEMEEIKSELEKIIPQEFVLENNYPNPFNPETVIPVKVPQESFIELSVFNILGEKIDILYNGALSQGRHLFQWDGRSRGGALMPSGVYFYQMQIQGGARLTKKMILMR